MPCRAVLLPSSLCDHKRILDAEIPRTENLIVYLPVDPTRLSFTKLNKLLLGYYDYMRQRAMSGCFRPSFRASVVLALPECDTRLGVMKWPEVTHIVSSREGRRLYSLHVKQARAALCLQSVTWNVFADKDSPHFLPAPRPRPATVPTLSRYAHVAVGGTFDRLHMGHCLLLSTAAVLARRTLVVGLTVEPLLSHKTHADHIQTFSVRRERVRAAVKLFNPSVSCVVLPMRDRFGPLRHLPHIQSLVVSEETEESVLNIKRLRPGLSVHVTGLVTGGAPKKVSSTELRRTLFSAPSRL